jgi:hypothetical protein
VGECQQTKKRERKRPTYGELAEEGPDLLDDARGLEARLGLRDEGLGPEDLVLGVLYVAGHIGVRSVGLERGNQLLELLERLDGLVVVLLDVEAVDEVLLLSLSLARLTRTPTKIRTMMYVHQACGASQSPCH